MNKNFDTNVSGTHVLTHACVPLLLAASSPRLLFLTSGIATLTGNAKTFYPPWVPNPPGGWPKEKLVAATGYRVSKAALNMLTLTWHWVLKEDGVRTWAVSPGLLATNLGGMGPERMRAMGAKDPSIGGDLIRRVIEGERDADVGKVVNQDGAVQDW